MHRRTQKFQQTKNLSAMAFFTSPNPHFFKIILHHTLIEGKLDLPKKFVKNDGDSLLHSKATLNLPDGAKWEVELKKSDGKISFVRGWSEFVKFYSVKAGYFVVFGCEGNSCFNVLIFDLSATEINYPMKPRTYHRKPKSDRNRGFDRRPPVLILKSESEEDEEDDSVQILNDEVLRKRRREKDAYCSLRELKKMMRKNVKMNHRFTTPQRFSDEEDEDEEEEDLEMNYSRRQSNYRGSAYDYGDGGRFSPESMRPVDRRRTPQPLTENQERVLLKASAFKLRTKNPSFMVTMRPSYIQTGNYLSLPRSFAERYLRESVDVKLEVADGRAWSVWCGVRWAFTRRRTELKGGWKRFAVDNRLQEGDVCVFELINKTPKVFFKVTIFHLPPN